MILLVGYCLSLRVLQNSLTAPLLFSYRYLSDGFASSKSDVYAFGVVLFEIISGKEAFIRTEGTTMKNTERRSLASIVSSIIAHSKIHILFQFIDKQNRL